MRDKYKKKRMLAVLLSALMVFGLLPMGATAANPPQASVDASNDIAFGDVATAYNGAKQYLPVAGLVKGSAYNAAEYEKKYTYMQGNVAVKPAADGFGFTEVGNYDVKVQLEIFRNTTVNNRPSRTLVATGTKTATLRIEKDTLDAVPVDVYATSGQIGVRVGLGRLLPILGTGRDYGALSYVVGNITGDPVVSEAAIVGNELVFSVASKAAVSATGHIPVKIDSPNFTISGAAVRVILNNTKAVVSIGGISVQGKVYDGKPVAAAGRVNIEPEGSALPIPNPESVVDFVWRQGDKVLPAAPTDAGRYTLTVKVKDSNSIYVGTTPPISFDITKKDVTVRVEDKTVYPNKAIPALTVRYDGFVGAHATNPPLSVKPVLTHNAPNTKTVGTFDITFQTQATLTSEAAVNYTLKHVDGKLYVTTYRPGGGGGGGGGSSSRPSTTKPAVTATGPSVADASVTLSSSSEEYTGSPIMPAPLVRAKDGKELVEAKDYKVTYENNTEIGNAKVVVSGMGAYRGSTSVGFRILPPQIDITAAKAGKRLARIRWSGASPGAQITNYVLRIRARGSSKWLVRTVPGNVASTVVKGLARGKRYQVSVCAVKTVGAERFVGAWSAVRMTQRVR
ncbi:MAG: fibronectin type III domain-containing protein [Clostridiales Family XIII bacterium]|jgi:hypothetical protein|nr:fibronectin type III domain-containing protein [Clostridiales Family XIII bacterium]